MDADDLTHGDVAESIVNALVIDKVIRSRSPVHGRARERLYIIKGLTYGGTLVHTKGKTAQEAGREVFHVLVSAKIATYAEGT